MIVEIRGGGFNEVFLPDCGRDGLQAASLSQTETGSAPPSFTVSFSTEASGETVDGRLILMLSKNDDEEPRFQVRPGIRAIQMFGINVTDVAPGQQVVIDESVFGYPHDSLGALPPGDYFVQALLHKYDTFELASGHTVQLPMDQGEGAAVGVISWQPVQRAAVADG